MVGLVSEQSMYYDKASKPWTREKQGDGMEDAYRDGELVCAVLHALIQSVLDGINALICEAGELNIGTDLDGVGGEAAADVLEQGFLDVGLKLVKLGDFVGFTAHGEDKRHSQSVFENGVFWWRAKPDEDTCKTWEQSTTNARGRKVTFALT